MRQLSPEDAMLLNMDQVHNPITISMMWICDQGKSPNGVVRHKEILQHLEENISRQSMFKRRIVSAPLGLDYPYWLEDENFDLEYHVRHVGLPQPGDWRQLCIFVARTMSRSMDENRPPWEIYIIEGLNNVDNVATGCFAVLMRMHHAYVDGQAGLFLMEHLLTDTPEGKTHNQHVDYSERAPTSIEMWARTIPNVVGQTAKSAGALVRSARAGSDLFKRLKGESKPDQFGAPRTIFTAKVSPHRVYNSISWSIKELKTLRQLVDDSSLNDVIVSIVGGGMRRYLAHHNDLPDELSLIALLPVSVRAKGTEIDGGNEVSTMIVSIGTDTQDPIKRLEQIRDRTQRAIPLAKEVIIQLGRAANDVMPAYVHKMLTWGAGKLNITSKRPTVNTLITNVTGPRTKKYFAGAPIVSVHPTVSIQDGIGITHFILGIEDVLSMGVLSDRAVMKDIDYYIECMQESTQEYLDHLELQSKKSKRRTSVSTAAKTKRD